VHSKNFDKKGQVLSKKQLAQIDLTQARKVVSQLRTARARKKKEESAIKATKTGNWGKLQAAMMQGQTSFKQRAMTEQELLHRGADHVSSSGLGSGSDSDSESESD
jgi:hypothetical protein